MKLMHYLAVTLCVRATITLQAQVDRLSARISICGNHCATSCASRPACGHWTGAARWRMHFGGSRVVAHACRHLRGAAGRVESSKRRAVSLKADESAFASHLPVLDRLNPRALT